MKIKFIFLISVLGIFFFVSAWSECLFCPSRIYCPNRNMNACQAVGGYPAVLCDRYHTVNCWKMERLYDSCLSENNCYDNPSQSESCWYVNDCGYYNLMLDYKGYRKFGM